MTKRYMGKLGCQELINDIDARRDTEQGVPYQLFLNADKLADIVRLSYLVSKQPVGDILEFGSGVSTLLLAFCCKKNEIEYGYHGTVHCLEADATWQNLVETELERHGLSKYVEFHLSVPEMTVYDTTPVMSFDKLPNICPNFIYVDGPRGNQAVGTFKGIGGSACISCLDVLYFETTFPAHTKIVVDGKLSFVKFYEKNLKRNYRKRHIHIFDQTEFDLMR